MRTTGSVSTTTSALPSTTGFPTSGPGDTVVGEGEGVGFLIDPDGGVADIECGVWEDENLCPRGEDCSPWANDGGPVWNATLCDPVPDNPDSVGEFCVAEGSPVSGLDSCEAQSMCFGVDPKTLQGTCVAYCLGEFDSTSCADPDAVCVVGNDLTIAVCLRGCDPLLQDCDNGEMCVGNYGEQTGFFCIPPGTPYVNAGGVQPAACNVGQVGVAPALVQECTDGEPCCAEFCDVSQPDPCAAGLECTLWTPEGTCPGVCDEAVCLSPA